MYSSLPARTIHRSTSSYTRTEIITTVHEFYSAIVKGPYIDVESLVIPPRGGWTSVNEYELRRRGKTEEVITLLRHLPYLRNPDSQKKWMLSPDTLEIAYCDGELYDEVMDELQPTPPHCIWLTKHVSSHGIDLLLDTHTNTITEWSMASKTLMLSNYEYERLAKQDKWMGHATFSVKSFFQLWQARWEKLVWLPINNPREENASVSWWRRAIPYSDEEEAILVSDGEFESESESESDEEEYEDDGESEETGSYSEDDAQSYQTESSPIRCRNTSAFSDTPSPDPAEDDDGHSPEQARVIYEIFKRNGWPEDFDRQRCKIELEEFRRTVC